MRTVVTLAALSLASARPVRHDGSKIDRLAAVEADLDEIAENLDGALKETGLDTERALREGHPLREPGARPPPAWGGKIYRGADFFEVYDYSMQSGFTTETPDPEELLKHLREKAPLVVQARECVYTQCNIGYDTYQLYSEADIRGFARRNCEQAAHCFEVWGRMHRADASSDEEWQAWGRNEESVSEHERQVRMWFEYEQFKDSCRKVTLKPLPPCTRDR